MTYPSFNTVAKLMEILRGLPPEAPVKVESIWVQQEYGRSAVTTIEMKIFADFVGRNESVGYEAVKIDSRGIAVITSGGPKRLN